MKSAPDPVSGSGALSVSAAGWSVLRSDDGIWLLTFNAEGRSANVFTATHVDGLANIMAAAAAAVREGSITGLVIRSGKVGTFIVGADLEVMAQLQIHSSDVRREAVRVAEIGQKLFGALEALPIPTLVVINGTCMGGGTELALACTIRVMTDHPKARMALPEVRIGILPAWGGTTRLPRIVGLRAALPLLLSGRSVDCAKAIGIGLADTTLPDSSVHDDNALLTFARGQFSTLPQLERARARRRNRIGHLLTRAPFIRALVLWWARRSVLAQTGGHYPAPLRLLQVLVASMGAPLAEGLRHEAEALGDLLGTRECRHLVRLFLAGERLRRREDAGTGADQTAPVRRVLAAYVVEVGHLLDEGVRPIDIRRAAEEFGMLRDPFETLEHLGADTIPGWLSGLQKAHGDRFRAPASLTSEARIRSALDRARRKGVPDRKSQVVSAAKERLAMSLLLEGFRTFQEGALTDPDEFEAAVVGVAGFPPFLGGPLTLLETRGANVVAQAAQALAGLHGPRFSPPNELRHANG
jgi:enoyl-CoA hydratase/carnithine racemase